MKTEFKILEIIPTVVRPTYYLVLYQYVHNKIALRLLKVQNCFCRVYWVAADSPASKERK